MSLQTFCLRMLQSTVLCCFLIIFFIRSANGHNNLDVLSNDDCASIVDQVGKCWLDYPDVPACRGRDDLDKCAANGLHRASSCNEDTKNEIWQMSRVYSLVTSALCQNQQLQKGFEQKRICWVMARNCALPLAFTTVDNATSDRCIETIRGTVICGYHNFMCQQLQQNYTRALFSMSTCHQYEDNMATDFSRHLAVSSSGYGNTGPKVLLILLPLLGKVWW